VFATLPSVSESQREKLESSFKNRVAELYQTGFEPRESNRASRTGADGWSPAAIALGRIFWKGEDVPLKTSGPLNVIQRRLRSQTPR
jgi:hypothetical protein